MQNVLLTKNDEEEDGEKTIGSNLMFSFIYILQISNLVCIIITTTYQWLNTNSCMKRFGQKGSMQSCLFL